MRYHSSPMGPNVYLLARPFGKMSGSVSSCGASNFSGLRCSFAGSWSRRGQRPAGDRRASEFRRPTDRVEPGAGVGVVVLAAVAVEGDGLVEVRGDVAVGDEVRRLRRCHLDGGAQDDSGQAVAADRRPEQLTLGSVGSQPADLAVGGQQIHRPHVVAEAARAVVVLAVDVARDRAADGDLAGAGQHRHPQPERQRRLHQRVEADAGVEVDQAGVAVDGVDPVQRGHVDDQAAAVLRVVAVGAAQSAGDHAALAGLRHGLGDHLGIRRRQAPARRSGRCGPSRSGVCVVVGNIVTRVPCAGHDPVEPKNWRTGQASRSSTASSTHRPNEPPHRPHRPRRQAARGGRRL